MRTASLRSLAALATALAAAAACTTRSGDDAAGDSANASLASNTTHEASFQGDFKGPLGVQLWSFRKEAEKDPAAMLTMTRQMGFTHVETAGLYGMTPQQFADAIKAAGLQVASMHVGYDELRDSMPKVISTAKTLGAKYVGLAWYPHDDKKGFTEADAKKAVADFNKFGRALRDSGLTFFYHTHGYEPVKSGNGTLLDYMITQTDPDLVKIEMDVLWTYLPGVDPAGLIRKYPGRVRLMHIKDMKPGVARGSLAGGIPDSSKAVIGEGQVNWSEVMAAAQKDGLEYYFLEDETTDPVANAPKSFAYLERLKY
ncbi:MAG TPA: sugar phosphate isomerase/epimerase [Gemmatimonadaceae bacterium]|nr:sugar phosphate isomerase/epimerase [Gemmatimonadaceae bacterium]